nr:immunoglobulin heavy chain junction region [Mus musculus]
CAYITTVVGDYW